AELREDVRQKLTEQETTAIDGEFRQAAVDAAVAEATIDVPVALVEAKAAELWGQLSQTLARQGISREQYLQISGKTEGEMVQEARPDAEQALRREAVLAAVVEAEGIGATEDELLEALEHSAEHEKTTAAKLLERLRSAGRADTLAADIARRKAVDVIADATTAIPVDQAQARDKLWTPGQDAPEEAGDLWTPDS
ncbi:MAG: trigger factor, partial [Solirubrobacteraceae bacterium]